MLISLRDERKNKDYVKKIGTNANQKEIDLAHIGVKDKQPLLEHYAPLIENKSPSSRIKGGE